MEKWTSAANLQIVSDNLMLHLCVKKGCTKKSCAKTNIFLPGYFHQILHKKNLHANYPGFSTPLAVFSLQNPFLQRVFRWMSVEGGVI